jgi:hypothetical protein
MKTIKEYTIQLPEYSLCYLINGDSSGLSNIDIQAIDNWYAHIDNNTNHQIIINPIEDEGHFTWYPEFGLACNCVDCTILILSIS